MAPLPDQAQMSTSGASISAATTSQSHLISSTPTSIVGSDEESRTSITVNRAEDVHLDSAGKVTDFNLKKFAPPGPRLEKDPNLLEWNGPHDPENAMNWSPTRRWVYTMSLSAITFCVTFASSVFSSATAATSREFQVDEEVMVLGTSLFVLGFALGPSIWGPTSEVYGRKRPLMIGMTIFAVFQIPVAVARNVETILLARFFGGVAGCAPLSIVSGQLVDMHAPVDRGVAMGMFAAATFIGPVAGPIAGSFIMESSLGWRWTAWLTLIMTVTFGLITFTILPETFGPVILQKRARKIRFETKNWAVHAKLDEQQLDFRTICVTYILRPAKMLFLEPILLLLTIYMAFVYAILYLFFFSYPITFAKQRGWSQESHLFRS